MAFFYLQPMERQPHLSNNLVKIRPLAAGDFEDLYAAANDPLIWEQHPVKRYKREVFEGFFKSSLETGGALVILDAKTNEIIGSSRFNLIPNVDKAIEIGWSFLMRKYWGGVYNKSFKHLMMEHAFQYWTHVLYYVDRDNLRSKVAMMKLGAKLLEGVEYQKFKKPNKDHFIFLLTSK